MSAVSTRQGGLSVTRGDWRIADDLFEIVKVYLATVGGVAGRVRWPAAGAGGRTETVGPSGSLRVVDSTPQRPGGSSPAEGRSNRSRMLTRSSSAFTVVRTSIGPVRGGQRPARSLPDPVRGRARFVSLSPKPV